MTPAWFLLALLLNLMGCATPQAWEPPVQCNYCLFIGSPSGYGRHRRSQTPHTIEIVHEPVDAPATTEMRIKLEEMP